MFNLKDVKALSYQGDNFTNSLSSRHGQGAAGRFDILDQNFAQIMHKKWPLLFHDQKMISS